ncbi:unnamed protein product [Diamesa serratosioi]
MEKWEGSLAVVTGASSGIGAALTCDLARAGVNVVGLARRVNKIEEHIKELGPTPGKVYAYKCDVTDQESIKEAFKWIEEQFGFIRIMINNAGVMHMNKILDMSEEAGKNLNQNISTNFTGVVHCCREAYRLMKKSNDYCMIINISSIIAHSTSCFFGCMNVCGASKFATRVTSEALRQELVMLDNDKIRVSNVSPGFVGGTEKTAHFKSAPELKKKFNIFPFLNCADISQGIFYILSIPYSVNITELTIRSVGERC